MLWVIELVDEIVNLAFDSDCEMSGIKRPRPRSIVWDHFESLENNIVRCMLCDQHLTYHNNTSSMLRHLPSKHPDEADGHTSGEITGTSSRGETSGTSKQARQRNIDEALVDMIVKDSQPFSMVEDEGFRAFVQKLDPTYVLPSRHGLKDMVEARYKVTKEKVVEEVKSANTVNLTSDMWTSINTEAYLAVTYHYINEEKLCSVVLGVLKFPETHTAEHIKEAKSILLESWGIRDKVTCLVTDHASNMTLCANLLQIRHIPCFAHVTGVTIF
nr:uncharacterized protein LOC129431635 [Misgurnus anguillicaudatus]